MGALPGQEDFCFHVFQQSTLFKGHFIPILQKSFSHFLARMWRVFFVNLFFVVVVF